MSYQVIDGDYSSKPWNRSHPFSDFIKPKVNMSISLKDHKFNRLHGCALTIPYHIDDIHSYLESFTTTTNEVAILDHGFMKLEVLKPIFTAIALLRFHIFCPFHTLLMDDTTVYSTLLLSLPTLHQKMLTIHPSDLLTTKNKVFNFVSPYLLKRSRSKEIILESLQLFTELYSNEMQVLIKILLKIFAGLEYQKGHIFRFGESANKNTPQDVAKISEIMLIKLHY